MSRRARPAGRGRDVVKSIVSLAVVLVLFVVPFAFIVVTALKSRSESAELRFTWPSELHLIDNLVTVLETRQYMLVRAFINSTVLTVATVVVVVVLAAMLGYVLARRHPSRVRSAISAIILAGLIVPAAIVPTVWLLQAIGLYRTIPGLTLVLVAYGLPFCTVLYRAFVSTIPRELDEAAMIDGAGPARLFFSVIFPLLRSITITVVIIQSVSVFNDFLHPLYYLPGNENVTVQLTLYNFQSQFNTQWNLLFMNILLITVPPLVMFILFSRRIVSGMTSGALK
ncbi:binding-protein-dependent transport systems inner membrane component [Beutenbergia cavernae DSM 12333]|uniref:Binding-protein-dependent transport systems inner membrane component n=1 Tax=Beutenbergia cavernae (strain ATCC BAA-8 / DSM 12333 / CCUG 43141 / JCM 11478 / NBRC 16432 / NCIMB 13614 / HKI 0122) TaxID=471853 RepID=C5C313_BEUC1|nr:carbohydrate ABC transporter permease [Beutenbergia cavernae]ACQ81857.1 binding-protein-dependent transport systems inner membrane component [Beutenbergia cavernae DSM 12333]